VELHLVDPVPPGVVGVEDGPVRVGEAAVLLCLCRARQTAELRERDSVVPLDPPGNRFGQGSVPVEEVSVEERLGLVGDLVRAHYCRVGRTAPGPDHGSGASRGTVALGDG
jgi:hypothetical protein